jgi:nucleotide-binding universal stress UspA family protein
MYHRVLVPLDGSATSDRGLQEAIGLSREEKAELILLHVVDDSTMVAEMSASMTVEQTERARARLDRLREHGTELLAAAEATVVQAGLPVRTVLREVTEGRIGEIVVAEAQSAACDLIVMGTHGRRGFSRLVLGSAAELVVRASTVPVLLVRHPEAKAA